jgi:ssRNA-specific RNase YbeY (16S rRNA maturation enzyme)
LPGAAISAATLLLGAAGLGAHAAPVVIAEGPHAGIPAPSPTVPATAASSPLATSAPTATSTTQNQPPPRRIRVAVTKPKVPESGPGTYVTAKVNGTPAGSGIVVRFDVRREKNVPVDVEAVARTIQEVLNDRRSWRGSGTWEFRLVGSADQADLHVYIATPETTDRLCAPLLTRGEVSCQNGNRIILNAKRWILGAESYGSDLTNYRRYLVNHEFGHALGYDHTECPAKGKRAGVMMQQTKGLDGCRANPWPYPRN